MYLNSYQVESRFYSHFGDTIKGIKIPHVYYNLEDAFNNKFGMILEEIHYTENGQPEGFSFENSKICLQKLAKFHASNWNKPLETKGRKLWGIGGYWTGNKREANKKGIKIAWYKAINNFGENLMNIYGGNKDMGKILDEKLHIIAKQFNALQPLTLVHGDYKISNIFVDNSNNNEPNVFAIDWQWFGQGNAAIDVAYFLATSVHKDDLNKLDQLLKIYYHSLLQNGITNYSFEIFYKQFQICWIDFFMYTVVAKWSWMTPKDFLEYQKERKDGLHLRSFCHMKKLIQNTEIYLKNF